MDIAQGHFGKYELHQRLGQGGMGEVWKAYDSQLQRYVAIKFLHADLRADPDFMTRFVREAQTVAFLHHPNIVQIHDFWTPDSSMQGQTPAYMVMNYVEGQTLSEYIHGTSRKGLFPDAMDIARLFMAISSAIDYAHQHGVVHRDIKPANILLDKRNTSRNAMGEPVLTDFGIVKLVGAGNSTLIKGFIGTPSYVPPEQAQGHAGDWRSDIYSLGVILYEIWTGVRPFQGDNPFGIAVQHVNTLPPPPHLINPKIPPPIAEVILAGLAKNPEDRFSSASAMTNALIQAINQDILSAGAGNYEGRSNSPLNQGPKNTPVILHGETPVDVLSAPIHPANAGDHQDRPSDSQVETLLQNRPVMSPLSPSTVETPTTPVPPALYRTARGKRLRPLFALLIAMCILVLIGSSLGVFFLFSHKNAASTSTISQAVVGNAFFVSSGQVQANDIRGIADEFQISLTNIPAPAAGKNYYVWLLSDLLQHQATFTALGKLLIENGDATLRYPGDIQHANLLATMSRLLITEEGGTPVVPSSDRHTWRYYAELPQKPDPVDAASALDRIRGLLCINPTLQQHNIHAVLDIQFLKNTQAVFQLANVAWNSKSADSIRSQVADILDYLDGEADVRADVPTNIALPIDQMSEQLALIATRHYQASSNYVYLIHQELYFLQSAPGITSETAIYHLAFETDTKLNGSDSSSVLSLLQEIHTDAKNLIGMTDGQLLAPSSLAMLNDMKTSASNAYAGAVFIDNDIQHLATFEIKPSNA